MRGFISRFEYLIRNFLQNMRPPEKLKRKRFSTSSLFCTSNKVQTWSPGRGLSEQFVTQCLQQLVHAQSPLERSDLSILDIGCGSGRSVELFEEAGLTGKWHGIDIDDRFVERNSRNFVTSFSQGDILTSEWNQKFDVVYTNSALEHIPFDPEFPNKISNWLKPKGIQVHIVPAPAALFLYLWHGWRQYSLRKIEEDFRDSNVQVFPIGGLFTSALQFFLITFWENIFKVSLRSKFSETYKRLLYNAIKADQYAPIFPVFYAVVASNDPAPTKTTEFHDESRLFNQI